MRPRRPTWRYLWLACLPVAAVTAIVAVLVGSGGSGAAASRGAHAAQNSTVWLCRPGVAGDPCAGDLTATAVPAQGSRAVVRAADATSSRFDCFYVYPTVSTESGTNADLSIQPPEIAVARFQAQRFSQVCRVWAPMYRQVTEAGLLKGLGADPQADLVAYDSVLSAWRNYLADDNDGRPVVFIGHSQGAAMLIRLLKSQVDRDATLRKRMVLAIILGGNVTVPAGRAVGATFSDIPVCTRAAQAGCVIAYSSFPSEPPVGAVFGRPGQGVSLQAGESGSRGLQVACVNPAAIGGGNALLSPYFMAATEGGSVASLSTPWVTFPGLYRAACESRGGASWLNVTTTGISGDRRPVVTEQLGPEWGYHLDDVNLALGNLVSDVAAAEATYGHSTRG